MSDLARALTNAGKMDEALSLAASSYKLHKEALGQVHRKTVYSLNTLFVAHLSAGTPDLALPPLQEAVKNLTAELGRDHPDTLNCMNTLAAGYLHSHKLRQALPLAEETFELRKKKLGKSHSFTLSTAQNLALIYQRSGKLEKALSLLEQTASLTEAELGLDHTETLTVMHNLAAAHADAGNSERSLKIFRETLPRFEALLGSKHHRSLAHMVGFATALLKAGKPDEALQLGDMIELHKAMFGPQHPRTIACVKTIDECQRLLAPMRKYKAVARKHGAESQEALVAQIRLSQAFRDAGYMVAAESHLRQVVQIKSETLGAEAKSTLHAKHLLAWAMHRQLLESKRREAIDLEKNVLAAARRVLGNSDATRQIANDFWQVCLNVGHVDEDSLVLMQSLVSTKKFTKILTEGVSAGMIDLPSFGLRVAALNAWIGRDEAYSKLVKGSLQLARNSEVPDVAACAAMARSLRPTDEKVASALALKLARIAVERGKNHKQLHWFQLVRGIAENRDGDFIAAEASLLLAIKNGKSTSHLKAIADRFLAMCLFHRGMEAEARKLASSMMGDSKLLPDEMSKAVFLASRDELILWLADREMNMLLSLPGQGTTR